MSQIHDVKEIGAVVPPEDPRPSKAKAKRLPASIPRGTQYKTLFREGCGLRRRGYEEAEIAAALWSLHKNRSEGPDAKHEQGDITTIAHSICERYPAGQTAFVRSKKTDTIIPDHQGNIRLAVAQCGVELSYNLFAEKELIQEAGGVRLPFDDAAQEDLWLRIDREIGFRPSFFFFEKVARFLARENTFHPVRDYLHALQWDGEPRINTWLVEYGGAKDEPPEGAPPRSEADDSLSYLESVSSLTLMAAVKRALEPGCKYDEMLVLESSQGLNKSTGVRALCPDETWFSDDLSLNSKSKELIEHTLGKWIIEASDLSGKKKTEIEQLKAMMSRQCDGPARAAYAHKPVERPRHFILIGTTNSHAYLTDSTGARRFWPVRVQLFDIDTLVRDRDQLWAEAVVRVRNGESIRMPQALWLDAAQHQEARRELDPWEATLQDTLDMIKASGDGKRRVTAEALFLAVGLVDIARRDRPAQLRVSTIMQRLGFTRRNVWNGEKTVTGYIEETPSALAVDPEDTRTR